MEPVNACILDKEGLEIKQLKNDLVARWHQFYECQCTEDLGDWLSYKEGNGIVPQWYVLQWKCK